MVSNKESAVIFVDIEETYSYNEDLVCKFVLNHYTPQEGDRIALYRLGWKSVRDYIVFEWAPIGLPETIEHHVVFEKHYLPRNESEIYQICYISSENILHGATIPFQFQEEVSKKHIFYTCSSSEFESPLILSSFENIMKIRQSRKERERNSANSTPSKRSIGSNESLNLHNSCEKQIAALKLEIEELQKKLMLQQNELNRLKTKKKPQNESIFIKDSKYELGELDPIPPFPLNI
ncbi:calcium-binding and coiled-coil domain-containing protein 2-like [Harmonia axyridis]|uniref:calcium-binding and coiled-coil domain-containing protein 2-like n=1 Tax=Harmonia axyridis TaxID=115357 RepID=UPI001E278A1A|nr:calcium-binding and coiled-coil domain-containing protein 2-like [Harmonia axyridis]